MEAALVQFRRHQQDGKVKVADKPGLRMGVREGDQTPRHPFKIETKN